jgi:hypothetical protein
MRYRLRTLLIVLALGSPVIAGAWWGWCKWRDEQERDLGAYPVGEFVIPIAESATLDRP